MSICVPSYRMVYNDCVFAVQVIQALHEHHLLHSHSSLVPNNERMSMSGIPNIEFLLITNVICTADHPSHIMDDLRSELHGQEKVQIYQYHGIEFTL